MADDVTTSIDMALALNPEFPQRYLDDLFTSAYSDEMVLWAEACLPLALETWPAS